MRKDLYIHSNGVFFQSFLFVLSNREPKHFHLYLPTFLDNDTDENVCTCILFLFNLFYFAFNPSYLPWDTSENTLF